ncbi:zinc finger matrin-type protein 3-like isoform X2 [Glandiceps talaboti]
MQPLYCKLCSVSLNSPQQAQAHYQGKNHAKKVRQYLQKQSQVLLQVHLQAPSIEETENTDLSSIEQNGTSQETNGSSEQTEADTKDSEHTEAVDPPSPTLNTNGAMHTKLASSDDFCKICGVSFNSPTQAQSHYQGKNHAKKQKSLQMTTNNNTPVDVTTPKATKKLLCFVCNVTLNSEAQLESHIKSYKHQQKVLQEKRGTKALQGRWGSTNGASPHSIHPPTNGTGNGIPVGIRIVPQNTLPNQHGIFTSLSPPPAKKAPPRPKDLAMVMTPSGKFYCACCDLMLNSEVQYRQHLQSKKHRAKHVSYKKPEIL